MKSRVAITGVGMITALGSTAASTFARLLAGERGFGPITLFDAAGQKSSLVGEVRDFRTGDVAPAPSPWSRTDALALVAAREALAMARLAPGEPTALAVGVTTGGMLEAEMILPDASAVNARPHELASYPLSSPTHRLSEALGPFDRTATLCSACSSGASAIVQAATWISSGKHRVALAGGTDALCRLTLTGFHALGAIDLGPCRPFDRDRAGLTLGEGAAFLVLESEESARRRDASVVAWLTGWAAGSEAHHLTHPEPGGAIPAALIRRALARAGLDARSLDYVNAHGTGTVANDAMEAAALRAALGPEVDRVFVSSSKGQLGHTLGAAGAIEAVITAMAVQRSEIPPTGGLADPAGDCQLRHVLGKGRAAEVRAALSSSFGFGGAGTTLLFEHEGEAPRAPVSSKVQVEITAVTSLDARGLLTGTSVDAPAVSTPMEPTDGILARLVASRSRRFDRETAMMVVGAEAALPSGAGEGERGLVAATAFGNVERAREFLRTLVEKGPRRVAPAEFPHLLPSSPAGNASIYLDLKGPVVTTCDLEASGEAAVLLAGEWVASGLCPLVVAGAVEALDELVRGVLGPLCEPDEHAARAEGSAWIVLEPRGFAALRGGAPLAVLHATAQLARKRWSAEEIASPRGDAPVIVCARAPEAALVELLARSGWAGATTTVVERSHGWHEGLGALAVATAAARIARGAATDALVVGTSAGRATLLHLVKPS